MPGVGNFSFAKSKGDDIFSADKPYQPAFVEYRHAPEGIVYEALADIGQVILRPE